MTANLHRLPPPPVKPAISPIRPSNSSTSATSNLQQKTLPVYGDQVEQLQLGQRRVSPVVEREFTQSPANQQRSLIATIPINTSPTPSQNSTGKQMLFLFFRKRF